MYVYETWHMCYGGPIKQYFSAQQITVEKAPLPHFQTEQILLTSNLFLTS